jgi:hypothetical protein
MNAPDSPWRAPVVWLGTVILLLVIAGCISLILSAARYPDESLAQGRDAPRSAGDEH